MPFLPDLDGPEPIGECIRTFYARVAFDELLGPVFVLQAAVNWPEHVERIAAFWCKLEHGIPGFNGSPTHKHSLLSAETPFRAEQFERWVELFHDTVDSGWQGPHAESIKARATMIAKVQSRLVVRAEPWGEDERKTAS